MRAEQEIRSILLPLFILIELRYFWYRGVVVITTTRLTSMNSVFRLWAASSRSPNMQEACNDVKFC